MERPRRFRRFGRGRNQPHTLLPLRSESRSRPLSHTVSCWYCDYKFSALNGVLFGFGRRYSKQLKLWFSIGVGFSLAALVGATLLLVMELAASPSILPGTASATTSLLFGFSPQVHGLSFSISNAAYLFFATLVSVSVHELGHAIAAGSEGIQVEYIAVFIALLFPGALVALNDELLNGLERFSALRVYCAGIWHNAACCAACGFMLFLLPLLLCPFYLHGETPMVLHVPSTSPLSGYLSPGDLIVSLDGKHVHDEHEWKELSALIQDRTFKISNWPKSTQDYAASQVQKGYCVPTSVMDANTTIHLVDLQSACPDGFAEFRPSECSESSKLHERLLQAEAADRALKRYCLTARDVVMLNKCGNGWLGHITNGSSCLCSEGEWCLNPVQQQGLVWAEITYASSRSPECLQLQRDPSANSETVDSNCGGTFIFVGDLMAMAQSIQLTSYQPRFLFPFAAYLPSFLEKATVWVFYVSLALALLNSLPVFYLDGESILELALSYFTWVRPSKKGRALKACLVGGTLISLLTFMKVLANLYY
ncbi:unnamed protein product [Linum trigynum]|uniref:Endopeptidase S2P n=1 Tax=Linum trigynum TaxID=586398 RepID=A0AAV2FXB2_9ROSI